MKTAKNDRKESYFSVGTDRTARWESVSGGWAKMSCDNRYDSKAGLDYDRDHLWMN